MANRPAHMPSSVARVRCTQESLYGHNGLRPTSVRGLSKSFPRYTKIRGRPTLKLGCSRCSTSQREPKLEFVGSTQTEEASRQLVKSKAVEPSERFAVYSVVKSAICHPAG